MRGMWNGLIWNYKMTCGGWLPKHFLFNKRWIPWLTKPVSKSEAEVCFAKLTMFSEWTSEVRLCTNRRGVDCNTQRLGATDLSKQDGCKDFEARHKRGKWAKFCRAMHKYLTVAAPSKTQVCGRSLSGIVGSNPTGGIDVCFLWVLSGTGLCVELITRSEESYWLWWVWV
jgi:hypothetical protein